MSKFKEKEDEEITPEISEEMLKNCKAAIAKFGFDSVGYEEFLCDVAAMKPERIVTMFPNEEAEEYRQKYLKQYESSLGDAFVINLSRVKKINNEGRKYETGWFIPRKLWDIILNK